MMPQDFPDGQEGLTVALQKMFGPTKILTGVQKKVRFSLSLLHQRACGDQLSPSLPYEEAAQ